MKSIYRLSVVVVLVSFIVGCGASGNENKGQLEGKKAELQKMKEDQQKLTANITKLEEEVAKLDTSAARPEKEKLVALTELQPSKFTHYIDLQGKIDAENIAYVSPRGGPGQVKEIFIKTGDNVRKGQLLLKLDDVVARRQIDQLETQISFAKDLAQRQQNLWDQKIGTEVQLLTAKNNVESLEKQMDLAKEQLSFSNVYAEMSGQADLVNVKAGEIFGTGQQIRIVNSSSLKVVTQVPENYLGKVNVGSNVLINLPEAKNDTILAKVSVAGSLIDPATRSFYIEAKIPTAKGLRPNQLALVKIQDYTASAAITVPVSTLQTDDKGKFVYVASKENGKLIARKRPVTIGELYGDKIEIKSGLKPGDQLVTEGFQGLYEAQPITTAIQ
jgi:RND family efflux transporter MFP subunit